MNLFVKIPLTNSIGWNILEPKAEWLEISLQVDGELAEAVAEVLSRFIPTGVVIEQLIPSERNDPGPPPLLKVAGYLTVDDQIDTLRQQILEALWYLGRIRELPEPQIQTIEAMDWSETWKKNYRPIPIGQKLLIAPSWVETDPQGRIVIRIDPGMAFGTGTHPTTQLCLEFLETEVQPHHPVIDVGCGSGILAVAALKMGASYALGVDSDPEAIRVAQTNADINGVVQKLEFLQGSVDAVRNHERGPRQAPLVVANILASILIELLGTGLADLITTEGRLILSGILHEQEQLMLDAALREKLQFVERKQSGDWVALLFHKY